MLPLCCEVLGGLADLSAQYTLQPCIFFFDLRRRKLLLDPHPDLFAPCDEISRLEENIARARPTLKTDKVYLLDGPEDDRNRLPIWAVNSEPQPITVWIHDRTGGDRGQFRPLQVGQGRVQIFYVAS